MKNILIKIGIGLLLLIGGWKIADRGDKIISKEDLRELQDLCENSVSTIGRLKGTYEEVNVNVGKLKSKLYKFTYDYNVDEVNYAAVYVSEKTSAKDSINIWYHKNHPDKNSINNPCDQLVRSKKEKTIGNSTFYYIGGILMILIGAGLVWNSIKQIIKTIFGKRKPKTTL
jgi:uncharacterized ion transporter superfamily protein YfcC